MNYTLFDLFLNAYNGNSFAQLQIVQRFQPLLKKYAALLKYEDAYSDLQLYLLELLHSGKLTKLQRKDDGTLVKYIESSIRHQYISLNSRKNAPTLSPHRLHRRRSCPPLATRGSNQTPGSQTPPSSALTVRHDCPHRCHGSSD